MILNAQKNYTYQLPDSNAELTSWLARWNETKVKWSFPIDTVSSTLSDADFVLQNN